jgi:Flp pilus assembly protein TadD
MTRSTGRKKGRKKLAREEYWRNSKSAAQPKLAKAPQAASLVKRSSLNHGILVLSQPKQNVLICILLTAATASIYFPVRHYPFINFDDNLYVTDNSHVNTGLNWKNVRWAFTAMTAGNWHPVTWLSHEVDCQIFGLYAGGHHVTNLMLHGLNALLLFLLLSEGSGFRWRSAMVAALFAVHPLNVESVAWVAERKNLLSTLFFLLALGAYGWYVRNPQIKRYLCVAVLFVLGLASKPMVITLPFVLLLVDFWPLGRIEGWSTLSPVFPIPQRRYSYLLMEKLPLLFLSLASAIVTLMAQRTADAVWSFAGWTLGMRLGNAVHSYAMYLWRTFVPIGLTVQYPGLILQSWEVVLSLLFLLATGGLVYVLGVRRPYVVMGFLWFLGTLIPVIGLIQVGSQSMADRYAYIPCIGLFIAVVWGVADAAKPGELDRRWIVTAAAVALVAPSSLTMRQLHFWRSSYDLWTRTLQVTVNNFVAEENLAQTLTAHGRDDEALMHFLNAAQISPYNASARLNAGEALLRHSRYPEAIEHFSAVIRLTKDPSHLSYAYDGLGVASGESGDRARARRYFLQALQFAPEDPRIRHNFSLVNTEQR